MNQNLVRGLRVSQRSARTPLSPIRKLSPFAQQAKKMGKEVLHLNIGQPDIESPAEFFSGLTEYHNPIVAYDPSQGNERLIEAWCSYMNRSLGLAVTPRQMMITVGASEALIFLCMVCCDPGDEIIIFDPTYANYIGFAAITGITLVPVHTRLEDGFGLPAIEKIIPAISSRTRAILVCNPNNPTGTVYSDSEMERLLAVCREHNLFLIVDETYREFVYDGRGPRSIFHLAPNDPRVVVVDSLSKRFSLCGARLGCIISSNEEVMQMCLPIAQARLAAPTIEQFAATAMLETIGLDALSSSRTQYESRRNRICKGLRKIPGVSLHIPSGAFYLIARLPVEDAEEFATFLLRDFDLNNRTVFLAPAAGFYMNSVKGRSKVRIAYVINEQSLDYAVEVIAQGLLAYRR